MSLFLGIDLGTSFSCAAAVRDDMVVVVEDDQRKRSIPSVVHYAANGGGENPLVGPGAVEHIVSDPENTVHSVKRMLGQRYGDGPVRIAQSAYLFKISEGPNSWPQIEARGGPYPITVVCAHILQELKERAERFFGEPVTGAVVTVPANANDAQREQTLNAARIAHLDVLDLVNEPTAAAMSYALLGVKGGTMAVYDFGGGTFDCSVIEWGEGTARVLATHGDSFLGGDDIDLAMALHIAQEFLRTHGVDLRRRAAEWKQLLLTCEAAKRVLSRKQTVKIEVPAVAHDDKGAVDLELEFSREELERLATPYIKQTVDLVQEAIAMAGISAERLDQVLLVGGSSRIPLVRQLVQRTIGKTPLVDVDPETAVAVGAALEAHRASGAESEALGRVSMDCVEVVPQSFGLATAGGGFDAVIKRNTPLPATGMRTYTTWRDGQERMQFIVLQGDSDKSDDNVRLGEFVIDDLPLRKAGDVEVELVFEVGDKGLLWVSGKDTTTNRVRRYRVTVADAGSSPEDGDDIVEEERS